MNQLQGLAGGFQEFVRSVRADLVEKHLWPLAVLLIGAAIAIPVVANKSSSGASTPVAQAPPAPATAPGAGVAATQPVVVEAHQGHLGAVHDPFAPSAATLPAAGAAGSAAPSSATAVRVTPTTPATAQNPAIPHTGTTGPQAVPAPVQPVPSNPHRLTIDLGAKSLRVYHVSFHFGQGTNVLAHRDAARLTVYPSYSTPVVQFLGVVQQGSKAAFLLWNAVSATGDGTCRRGTTPCDIVELKPGDSEFVDASIPGSGTVQYELDLDSIKVTHAQGEVQALQAHSRQSTAGISVLLKSAATALSQLKYSTILGTLVSASAKAASATLHPHVYVSGWGPQTQHH